MSDPLAVAQKHYQAFCNFENFQRQKSTAKDKLTKLSQHQFQELSTDVYDELLRREENKEDYLPAVASFHPKRNQARQKLSTLQRSRFDELVSDVYHEICARYPSVTRQPALTRLIIPGQPTQNILLANKQLASSTPNLSQISQQEPAPRKAPIEKKPVDLPAVSFTSLDNLMADLGGMMKDGEFVDLKSPTEKELLESDLQSTIENMKLRLKEKDDEIQRLLEDHQKQNLKWEDQFRAVDNELTKVKADNIKLQKDLEAEKLNQTSIKSENANLLSEIKTLSVENASLRGAKEKSATQITQLFDQIAELKQKESALKKENEDLKSKPSSSPTKSAELKPIPTSIKVSRTNPNIDFQKDQLENSLFTEGLEEYYIAVNTLLSETRSREEPSASILIAMKSVVLACKSLTSACENYEHKVGTKNEIASIKSQLSSALTNQMIACKQAAVSPTPAVKLNIEKELLVLTTVVLELVRECQNLDKSSPKKNSSIKSLSTAKSDRDGPSLYELKSFLESQIDLIVKAIQALLALLRQSNHSSEEFMDTINSLGSVVTSIVEASQTPLRKSHIDCDQVIEVLVKSRDNLLDLAKRVIREPSSKGLKQQIASISYEIAKQVKTLIGLID